MIGIVEVKDIWSSALLPEFWRDHPQYLAMILLGIALLVIAGRFAVVRTMLRLVVWGVVLTVLFLVIVQRAQFDPNLGRIATLLHLHEQEVVGKEVRIRIAPDGHFWANARIAGVSRRMLIDSGATITALSVRTARAAGLDLEDAVFPVVLRTANGSISAQTAKISSLRLGTIRANDLPVVVSPAFGNTDVLGMNFLSKLKSWRVEDGTLILLPHHPKPVQPTS